MPGQLFFALVVCFSLLPAINNAFAQTSTGSVPVQVVYVIKGKTLVTYNVNPQTLQPKQVGSLTLIGNPEYYALFPSANDHFVYVAGFNNNSTKYLDVYRTNSSGAPQGPPTQQLSVNYFYGIQFDPQTHFAYAVFGLPDGTYNTAYHIRRYLVNSTTGALSSPISEATYVLPNGSEGTEYCGVGLYGFNSAATKLYDTVGCSAHDGSNSTYFERGVNTTTGALGSDVKIYSWASQDGYDLIQFIGSHMFDFVTPDNYETDANTLNIYPLVPNTSKPQIQCTATMLADCAAGPGQANPTGKYLLMWVSQSTSEIDEVDWSTNKIVSTGHYLPYANATFGPGGSLVYAVNYVGTGYDIEIYGFDSSTGAVTAGGSISVPSGLDSYYTALRY
jgi:hypothetical protein